jgi:hypothetical protein
MGRAKPLLLALALGACVAWVAVAEEDDSQESSDDHEVDVMKDVDDFDEDLVKLDWHYLDAEQQQHGPLKFEHIKHLFFKGNITLYTAVWTPDFKNWKQLRTIPGIRNGLSAGRGYKERLQLFAIDENKFVKALRIAERQIPDVGSEGNEMFCARAGAVGEVLRREVVKRLLKDVLRDLREGETEKNLLLKSIKATRYGIKKIEKEQNHTLFHKRREAIILQKKATLYWNKMVALQEKSNNATVLEHWTDLMSEVQDLVVDEDTRYYTLAAIGVPLFAIIGCLLAPTGKPAPKRKEQAKSQDAGAASPAKAKKDS